MNPSRRIEVPTTVSGFPSVGNEMPILRSVL